MVASARSRARYDRALARSQGFGHFRKGLLRRSRHRIGRRKMSRLAEEQYRVWLSDGGAAQAVIDHHRIPIAGHVLGLSLKPHPQVRIWTLIWRRQWSTFA